MEARNAATCEGCLAGINLSEIHPEPTAGTIDFKIQFINYQRAGRSDVFLAMKDRGHILWNCANCLMPGGDQQNFIDIYRKL